MASYRDALRRLQIIYNECAPQAKERRDAEKTLDDFTRLKKMLHIDVKNIRQVNFSLSTINQAPS